MGKITDIQQQSKNQNRLSIFIDGEYYLGLDNDTFSYLSKKFKLSIGKVIDENEIMNLTVEAEYEKNKNYVINYCADKPEKTVREKLARKDVEPPVIEKLISFMYKYDLLDDLRYAQAYANDASRLKRHGRQKIKQALKSKGIDEQIIQKALKGINDSEQLSGAIKKLNLKVDNYRLNSKNNFEMKQKCYALLMRNGYETEIIQQAISSVLEEN